MPLPSTGALNVLGKLGTVGRIVATGWKGLAAAKKLTQALPGKLIEKGASFLTRIPGVSKVLASATKLAEGAIGKVGGWIQQRAGSLFGQGSLGQRVRGWVATQTKGLQAKAVGAIQGLPRTLSKSVVSYGMYRLGLRMPPRSAPATRPAAKPSAKAAAKPATKPAPRPSAKRR